MSISAYPRPLMERDSFFSLNGRWDFAVTRSTEPPVFDREILLPFAPETKASGIAEQYDDAAVLWYRRRFVLPEGFQGGRVLLHFEAVDQCCNVLVNGAPLCEHTGGYIPFSVDITEYLKAENELAVRVTDRLDSKILPYGKQKRRAGGMWYTPTTGIWQTVWLEHVPEQYIHDMEILADCKGVTVRLAGADSGRVSIETPEGVEQLCFTGGSFSFAPRCPRLWSPEDPYLYRFTVTTDTDRVRSYFALREIASTLIDGMPRVTLNGKPLFLNGLLDQGYWRDSGMTPPDDNAFEKDILAAKALGFNLLRKHIKVEARRFYYDCDRLGMLVMQDMVQNSDYSFLRDTALPTLGFLKKNDRLSHRSPERRAAFTEGMRQTVELLKNHPSVCFWTIFNEGWGQFDSGKMYTLLKSIDPTRLIDTASGWFLPPESDFCSRHIYFKRLKPQKSKLPYLISECGGFVYDTLPSGKTYGYGKCRTAADFEKRIAAFYREQVLPLIPRGLCGVIYTQLTDVEEEKNGLLTADRTGKISPQVLKDIQIQL